MPVNQTMDMRYPDPNGIVQITGGGLLLAMEQIDPSTLENDQGGQQKMASAAQATAQAAQKGAQKTKAAKT